MVNDDDDDTYIAMNACENFRDESKNHTRPDAARHVALRPAIT